MWKVIQELLPFLLVVLFITQLAIPLVFNGRTWWLFRPSKKSDSINKTSLPLVDEIKEAKAVVDKAKAKADIVKEKVSDNLKSAEDLKKEVDKL